MRPVTVAAVQVAPSPEPLTSASIADNTLRAVALIRTLLRGDRRRAHRAARIGHDRVHPRSRPSPSCGSSLSDLPGPLLDPFTEVAAELGIHLVLGTYRRGSTRAVVHNAAVVIGGSGTLLGTYHKTHPFGGERADRGGWVTPGDDVLVVDTPLGRIGVIICFDGDYPELARITAIRGAEILCRPSALLRSADLWELTNRARAYDNHVYVDRQQRDRRGSRRHDLLRQLDDRHADRRGRSPRGVARVLDIRPPGPEDGAVVADAGVVGAPAVRPPRGP